MAFADEVEAIFVAVMECSIICKNASAAEILITSKGLQELNEKLGQTSGELVRNIAALDAGALGREPASQRPSTIKFMADLYALAYAAFSRTGSAKRITFDLVLQKYSSIFKDRDRMVSLYTAAHPDLIRSRRDNINLKHATVVPPSEMSSDYLFTSEHWKRLYKATEDMNIGIDTLISEMSKAIEAHEKFFGDRHRISMQKLAILLTIISLLIANLDKLMANSLMILTWVRLVIGKIFS